MKRRILVGQLLLGALVIFFIATFYVKNWQFYVQDGYQLHAKFTDGMGLIVGDEVRMSGVPVGRVHTLSVDTDGQTDMPVHAVLRINEGVSVRLEDEARIETRSVFGGSFVSIKRGNAKAQVLLDGSTIRNTHVDRSIGKLISDAGGALENAGEAFHKAGLAMDDVRKITSHVAEGKGFLGKMISDEESYDEFRNALLKAEAAFEGMDKFLVAAREGEGLVARLLNDEQMAADVRTLAIDMSAAAADIKRITSDLREGKGSFGRFLADEGAFYESITSAAGETREAFGEIKQLAAAAREGEGVLAKLLTDKEMAARLDLISLEAEKFAAKLGQLSETMDDSTLGKLMKSDEAHVRLIEVLDGLRDASAALTAKTGTLGLLLTDDTLYHQVGSAVESIQRMLDDYREQSPILTFMGAVFGAM